MKVFLLETIKGKGEVLDIIEVASGYGNFLIRSGKALDAITAKKEIDELIAKESARIKKEKDDALALYSRLHNTKQSFERPLSPKGTFISSITKEDIAKVFSIDKKVIEGVAKITCPGKYNFTVNCKCGYKAMITVTATAK